MTEPLTHRIPAGEWSLAASEFPASGDPRGVVIVGHAAACNRKTLDRPSGSGLASALAEAGLHVYTFDLRGHGESGPVASEGGRWTYDEFISEDLGAMVNWTRDRHPDLRIGLLGHSLSGHASVFWLGLNPDAPVDALVVYSTNLWLPQYESKRMRWFKKRSTLALWSMLIMPFGYLPAKRLGQGTDDESAAMVRSFKRWAKTGRCTRESDGLDYLELREKVNKPVLAYYGENDVFLCTKEGCEGFLAPIPDHTINMVPGGNHMSLVTKDRSRPVWEETASWFIDKLSAK